MENLAQLKFGSLLVIGLVKYNNAYRHWLCLCDCGGTKIVRKDRLTNGEVKCCDACKIDAHTTHGWSKTRLYSTWTSMLHRTESKKAHNYSAYGGKGIKVCDEWKDFLIFKDWAVKNGYTDDLTIDRIDNNKGYYPRNCRWVPSEAQARNKTSNLYYTINGECKLLKDWAEEYGFKYLTIYTRVVLKGMDIEEALNTPSVRDDPYRGVCYCSARDKWEVRVTKNKQTYRIGRFDSKEEGLKARNKFMKENGLI